MAAMTEAIRLGTYAGLGILRPFIHMSKGGIAAMGQDLGVDFPAPIPATRAEPSTAASVPPAWNAGKPSGSRNSGSNGLCACGIASKCQE